ASLWNTSRSTSINPISWKVAISTALPVESIYSAMPKWTNCKYFGKEFFNDGINLASL
ncbi:unnamed protein product, partial [Larinioides sclopetarius]